MSGPVEMRSFGPADGVDEVSSDTLALYAGELREAVSAGEQLINVIKGVRNHEREPSVREFLLRCATAQLGTAAARARQISNPTYAARLAEVLADIHHQEKQAEEIALIVK
jgi:hypothetical protein